MKAKLKVYYGSMRAGKSTLALQLKENFDRIGEKAIIYSTLDDAVESRIGNKIDAYYLSKDRDLLKDIQRVNRVEHIIIDEAQFVTMEQAEQLADFVDSLGINVFAFGLLTDYRGKLFLGTKRLLELADQVEEIQAKSLCWCGRKGTHNMRIDSYGYPVIDGDIVVVGEDYEVLCRKHFYDRVTKQVQADIEEE